MANRFPLVIDTTDGNKIKELPSGDNLNLRESSIVNVQDVTALGTINAADITVNGERLVAQNFADLTDTPSSFVGAADYFVKVKEDGTGLEFRPFSDIGNIEVEQIEISDILLPTQAGTVDIGSNSLYFRTVVADEFKGDLISSDDTRVFEAATGKISYAALQGAPTSLSEFTDDIGFLRTEDLDDSLFSLFDEGVPFATDIKGSVFGDDSTLLIDGVNSVVTGDIDNFNITTGQLISQNLQSGTLTVQAIFGPPVGDMQIDAGDSGIINIGTGASTTAVNIENAVIETFSQGSGLGIPQIAASTDLILRAGNRVKIDGAVPFRVSSVSSAERGGIAPQSGDIIYNSSDDFVEFYQGNEWISLHQGTFTGNVTTATGESNFNNVVIVGNLTVSGTTTTVDTANTTIKDNVIVLNEGEVGAGVTAGTSGIEIDRGSETNKTLVWDETDDKWTVGSETFAANTFEAVGFQGSLFGNGGLNSPLQLTSGLEGQTGNTIFINPQGSDTLVQMWGETVNLVTGPFNTYDSPYVQFKTEGAFKAHQGAYFDGNLIGDVKGSIVGDDSTILVDGVAGKVTGDVENTEVITSTVQGRDSAALNIYRGTGGTVSLGDASSGDVSVGDSGINITSTAGVNVNGAAGAAVDIGTGSTTGNVTIGKAGNTTTIDGTFNATLTGNVVGDVTGDVSGNVTGNIDNTTLTVGTTDATTVTIGNSGSTTTVQGTIQFTDALIANNLTADDSIVIQTEGNTTSEAITLFPKGSGTAINLRADSINFIGSVASNIIATGGVTGDLSGSVFAQDSTLLVDGLDGIIRANVNTGSSGTVDTGTLEATTTVKTSRLETLTTGITDLSVSYNGTIDIEAGANSVQGKSNISLDKLGTSYMNLVTEPINPLSENALISINATNAAGDVQIGTPTSSRSQVVTIYNADIQGTLTGDLVGSVNGALTGSVVGSVFAEDSGLMVDAANYAMFSDTLSLTVLNTPPENITSGMIAISDGVGWDPLVTGVETLMVYLGGAWRQLATG